MPEFDEEEFYEKTPKRLILTGSTGINSLQDSSIRAVVIGIPAGILWFLQAEYEILSTDGYAALMSSMIPAGILMWGFFDRFLKPKIIKP